MSLTDRQILALKPKAKPYKVFDGGGLHIYVSTAGGKLWRMTYRHNGTTRLLSFGAYPAVTLKMARDCRDDAKALLAKGIDPSDYKKTMKKLADTLAENTFEAIAREWHVKFSETWTEKHRKNIMARLEKDVFPFIGKKPIAAIKAPDLLEIVRHVESRGAYETTHRAIQYCGSVFRYAIATGRAEHDISADLRGALKPRPSNHFATITDPRQVGQLLRAIDSYQGQFPVACALKIAPLVFVRPGELRCAEWREFDFDKTEWRIPAERMKMREQHIVPLSKQALAILHILRTVNGMGKYLFPSIRTPERPMSDNTINAALRRLGYDSDEMTGHGFRAMASTLLHELGWNRDAIERQLAHGERNAVRAAYNFAEFLPERRKMMQAWSDYLDELRGSI